MGKTVEVAVPDIGDYQNVPVIEVLVKEGDAVAKDSALITLESEKATMEVPAPAAGIVRDIRVKVGDKVSKGHRLMALETGDPGGGRREAGGEEAPTPGTPAATTPPKPPADAKMPSEANSASRLPPPASRLDVRVPDIGDYKNVPVIEVLVGNGATVEKDASLIVLESEKATMEVPAPAAGVVRDLKLKPADKVSQGDFICRLETAGAAEAAPAARAAPEPAKVPAAEPTAPPAVPGAAAQAKTPWAEQSQAAIPHASPMVRRVAREFGVDLAGVKGTGPRGRILQEDVQGFVKARLAGGGSAPAARGSAGIPPIPAVDFAQFGPVETKPLARIRKLSAAHLHRAWLNVPHVTQNDEADITELEAFRKAQSEEGAVKLTLLPFIMKAVAAALRTYPEFNASLAPDGESLVLKQYCNIGFAADTEHGLVVPVVKDVWSKGLVQLAGECGELAKKARDGKLKADEMKGGCFSISSLGGIGGAHFTPIVNAPEVGILGVSRAQTKPVWNGREFAPRLLCPLSLSYDHRVIDGAYAARFIVHLVRLLSDFRRVAL